MKTNILEGESVLSPRHLVRIGQWATRIARDKNIVWNKSDSKLALLVLIEQKRVTKLRAKSKELGSIDF